AGAAGVRGAADGAIRGAEAGGAPAGGGDGRGDRAVDHGSAAHARDGAAGGGGVRGAAGGAGQGGVRALRRSADLPLHRLVHPGAGHLPPRAGPARRLRRAHPALDRRAAGARAAGLRRGDGGAQRVAVEHGHHRHDVRDRHVHPGGDAQRGGARDRPALRHGADADDQLRRLHRRAGHAHRHAAQRDRHRLHPHHPEGGDHLLRVDGDRRARRRGPLRRALPVPQLALPRGRGDAGRGHGADPPRARRAGPMDARPALRGHRLRRDGGALGDPRHRGPGGRRDEPAVSRDERAHPRGRGGAPGRAPPLPPSRQRSRRAGHRVGRGGAHRLGGDPAVRRRLRAGRALLQHGPGGGGGPRPDRPPPAARRVRSAGGVGDRGRAGERDDQQHRLRQHGGPRRHLHRHRRRRGPAPPRPGRDDGGEPGLHAPRLHPLQRHRLRLRLRPFDADDPLRAHPGRHRHRRHRRRHVTSL
ncbi:MAG: Sodium-dependent anion transporter family, partial [uncultured Gemmatimonadetes bacterium]